MKLRKIVLVLLIWALTFADAYAQTPPVAGTFRVLAKAQTLCNGAIGSMLRASNGDLWIVGSFTQCSGQPRLGIARFRNGTLVPQALPNLSGGITSIAEFQGDIYIGGYGFVLGKVRNISVLRIRGDAFETIGLEPDALGGTNAMLVFQNMLYIAGNYRLGGVVRWDGVTLTGSPELPFGNSRGVESLAVHEGELYAGGNFENCLRQLVNGTWQMLSAGVITPCEFNTSSVPAFGVSVLASYNGALIVGGRFTQAGAIGAQNIVQMRNGQYLPMVAGANNGVLDVDPIRPIVFALAEFQNKLYIGGRFQTAGGVAAENLALYDGIELLPIVAGGANGAVGKLYPDGSQLFLLGGFSFIGNQAIPQAASWNGSNFTPALPLVRTAEGPDNVVTSLTNTPDGLLALGKFTTIANVRSSGIAHYQNTQWNSLPGIREVDGAVAASVVINGERIIAGNFPRIGTAVVNHSARYRNGAWESLGAGGDRLNIEVRSMVAFQGQAYLGGQNFRIAGQDCFSLMRWDGQQLRCVGIPNTTNPQVTAMAVHDGMLFISTTFAIYTFDGALWRQISATGNVTSFATHRGQLYVAAAVNDIARPFPVRRWDGANWNSAGLLDNRPCASTLTPCSGLELASYQNQLYASQASFGGVSGALMAFDGRNWRFLQELRGNTSGAIAAQGGVLYVAAGTSNTEYLSSWEAPLDCLFADGIE